MARTGLAARLHSDLRRDRDHPRSRICTYPAPHRLCFARRLPMFLRHELAMVRIPWAWVGWLHVYGFSPLSNAFDGVWPHNLSSEEKNQVYEYLKGSFLRSLGSPRGKLVSATCNGWQDHYTLTDVQGRIDEKLKYPAYVRTDWIPDSRFFSGLEAVLSRGEADDDTSEGGDTIFGPTAEAEMEKWRAKHRIPAEKSSPIEYLEPCSSSARRIRRWSIDSAARTFW